MAADQPDKRYLATRQYRDASNLNARGSLHARFGTNPYPWFRWVFDQALGLAPANARILEVGAGPGGLWRENLDRLPAGWRVTLTDLSAGMVAEECATLPAAPFTCAVADVETLPFDNANFDLVIANHMLYHVPDRPRALAELRRVLRPGAPLMAATNGQENMRELDDLLEKVAPAARNDAWRASFRHPFKLENGAEQLAPFFDDIAIRPYNDALDVTAAEPLIAYVDSIDIPALRSSEARATLASRIAETMRQRNGTFHISKSVGLFIAHRPA
ncbi:MAG: class I SAM-dependent methyltransferase [Chloroflexota bacterium]|nr:class I SAM-dependent methyltransferase [Chloroflexota bacterium]